MVATLTPQATAYPVTPQAAAHPVTLQAGAKAVGAQECMSLPTPTTATTVPFSGPIKHANCHSHFNAKAEYEGSTVISTAATTSGWESNGLSILLQALWL